MASFCTCGSLVIEGSCTNKKCDRYHKVDALASFRQIEYIKSIKRQLDEDPDDIEFVEKLKTLTIKEAIDLIDELKERLVE